MPEAVEPNRVSLIRLLRLERDATDADIVAGIRLSAQRMSDLGRKFELPPNLDLAGCLAAFRKQGREELELISKYARGIRNCNEKIRKAQFRILSLSFILDAALDPPGYDPLSEHRKRLAVEGGKRRKPKLDERRDHEVDDATRASVGKAVQPAPDVEQNEG